MRLQRFYTKRSVTDAERDEREEVHTSERPLFSHALASQTRGNGPSQDKRLHDSFRHGGGVRDEAVDVVEFGASSGWLSSAVDGHCVHG